MYFSLAMIFPIQESDFQIILTLSTEDLFHQKHVTLT